MNDSPFTIIGDDSVEARIVAWVLGEASAFEAGELERLCEERPELLIYTRRMRALHGLLAEAEVSQPTEDWKLSPEKRNVLGEVLGEPASNTIKPLPVRRVRHTGRRVLLSIAACALLTFAVLCFIPANYESEAVIEIKPQGSGAIGSSADGAPHGTMTPQFFATEIDKIKSRRILGQVVDKLDLEKRWNVDRETALSKLKNNVQTGTIKGTDLISIRAQADNPSDAKQIAEELTKSYQSYRTEIEHKDSEKYLVELNRAVRDQEDKVEERRKLLATIVNTKGIIYRGQDSFYAQGGNDGNQGAGLASQENSREEAIKRGLDAQDYVDAKRDFETDQELLKNLKLKKVSADIASRIPSASVEVHDDPSRAEPVSKSLAANLLGKASSLGGIFGGRNDSIAASEAPARELAKATRSAQTEDRLASQAAKRSEQLQSPRGMIEDKRARQAVRPSDQDLAGVMQQEASTPLTTRLPGELIEGTPKPINVPNLEIPQNGPAGLSSLAENGKSKDSTLSLADESSEEDESAPVDALVAKREISERKPSAPASSMAKIVPAASEADMLFSDPDVGAVPVLGKLFAGKKQNDELKPGLRSGDEKLVDSDFEGFINFGAPLGGKNDSAPIRSSPALTYEHSANIDKVRRNLYMAEGNMNIGKLIDEISAAENPYSTFSLNISDASFKVAQAALAKGARPDSTGVKVEQFYNAVDYGDPAPSGGEPIALAAEQCAHPIIPGRDLVRVSVKTAAAGRAASQPLCLTLLVDQSGSMVRGDRREAMKKALTDLAGLLTANDRVTLIGFSRTPHLLAEEIPGDQAGQLPDMVHQESAEGGTNLEEAIKLAAQLATRHKQTGAQNRIVLFTDGAVNLGDADPSRLAERVKALRQSGLAFDIAGIAADDLNDELLGDLARNGNGRYYVVGKGDDMEFARRLAGAFRPAAENVKVQVRFNPERVARYKLIGFEKDRLKTEDFHNDAVDAAELAADEAGVAIYQVETLPGGSGELGEVSVRFRDAANGSMVERSLVLPHKGSTAAIDKATPSMQLAVLSMLAAEKLRGGPLGESIHFSELAGVCGNVRRFFGPNGRAAEMLQVIDAIK